MVCFILDFLRCQKVKLMQVGSQIWKITLLQVDGYSYLEVVSFLGLPRNKLKSNSTMESEFVAVTLGPKRR